METLQGSRSKTDMRVLHNLFSETGFKILTLNEAIAGTAMVLIEEHSISDGLHVTDVLIACDRH